jgi:hypothetical protein
VGKTLLDSTADGKYLATTTYKGKTVVAYSDTQRGLLKLATWSGSKWVIQTVDGEGTKGGKTNMQMRTLGRGMAKVANQMKSSRSK